MSVLLRIRDWWFRDTRALDRIYEHYLTKQAPQPQGHVVVESPISGSYYKVWFLAVADNTEILTFQLIKQAAA